MNLRDWMDTVKSTMTDLSPFKGVLESNQKPDFSVRDQVVIRRPVGFSGKTREIIQGEILSFTDGGQSAVVAMARPGGVTARSTVSLDQLQHVSDVYRRGRVHTNPALRG